MITLKLEFRTKTAMGITNCTTEHTVYRNYRDIANVNEVVAYLKKFFGSKSIHGQSVDFCYDNDTVYGTTVARLYTLTFCAPGEEGITLVRFAKNRSMGEDCGKVKITSKVLRDLYLECADRAIEWEEEKERLNTEAI